MRALSVLTSAALLASVTAVVTAPQAAAADDFVPSKTLTRSAWGHTDLGAPRTGHANPDGDAPIGTWTDRRWHRTRSYFTFDVAEFTDKKIISAAFSAKETKAADCAKRAVELWRTEPYTGQGWAKQPRQLERLAAAGKPDTGCLVENAAFDISVAVKSAVERGDKTFTVALRVADAHEHDGRYHRTFANDVKLAVTYNTPPATPTNVSTHDSLGCDTAAPGKYLNPRALGWAESVIPRAEFSDADAGDVLTARFAVWPAATPETRSEAVEQVYDGKAYTYLRNADLAESTYAWQVRTEDGTDVSAWSQPCYFTVDRIAPNKPGTVGDVYFESEYGLKGAPGTPGKFTFSTNGSDDVVEFEYTVSPSGWMDPKKVPVGPDGKTVVDWTPKESGHHYLYVVAIDRIGQRSPTGGYTFHVRENRPQVWSNTYPQGSYPSQTGGVGVPGVFEFTPGAENVTEYSYRLNDGPTSTVAAGADGKASATVTPAKGGWNTLFVANKTASGEQSAPREYPFVVDDKPIVTHNGGQVIPLGTEVTFSFAPKAAGVTAYEWGVGWGQPLTRVAADADGRASVKWTAVHDVSNTLRVRSISGDVPTLEREVHLSIDGAAPKVVRVGAQKPREPGQLTFSTTMPNPVSYTWWSDEDSTQRTMPAGPDGRATVSWTPRFSGWRTVYVYATNATGLKTDWRYESLLVRDDPIVTSADFLFDGRPTGRYPGKFEFTASQPEAKEFGYSIGGPETVIPVGPDGKAELKWTPPDEVEHYSLQVFTRDAQGRKSTTSYYSFYVESRPKVTSTDFTAGESTAKAGVEGTFVFSPGSFDVAKYEYSFFSQGDDESGTITAGPDGTAELKWTPKIGGYHSITINSVARDGQSSVLVTYRFFVNE